MVTYVPQGNGVFATNEGPRRVITSLNIEHDTALVTYRDGRGSRSISPYE
jgi:hypothetical protein